MKNYVTPGFRCITKREAVWRQQQSKALVREAEDRELMNLRRFEHALLTLGLTFCAASLGVLTHREIWSRMAIRSFERRQAVVRGSKHRFPFSKWVSPSRTTTCGQPSG
jgi:hypothetical protein